MNLKLICFSDSNIEPPTATAQQKGERVEFAAGKYRIKHYKKRKVKVSEALWHLIFSAARSQFTGTICRPVKIELILVWPYPKTMPKAKRNGLIPRATKPDLDNIEKTAIDVLAAMKFFNNDSRIFSKTTEKYWGPFSGVTFRMWEDSDSDAINEMPPESIQGGYAIRRRETNET